MNRILRSLTLACVLTIGAATAATAQQGYVVIVNEAVPGVSITADELARLFQKRAVRWPNGLAAEPVDLAEDADVRERFSQDVFRKSTGQIKAFWQTQIFSGRSVPPVEAPNDAAAISFVQGHAGGVGYVSAATVLPAGVRRLRVSDR